MHDKFYSLVKKIATIIVVVVGFFSYAGSAHAIMPPSVEEIKKYDVNVLLSKEGSVEVVETINYDFGASQKRGIFRDIPVAYRNGNGTYYLPKFTVQAVTDERGAPYKYVVTPQNGKLNIRIGDADVVVSGEKTYILKYRAEGVVSYFSTSTELYWNAIGTHWPVPILQSTVQVKVPVTITSSACFAGVRYSTSTACTNLSSNTTSRSFSSTQILKPGEGLTVVLAMVPEGIAQPDLSQFVTTTNPFADDELSMINTDRRPFSLWAWVIPLVTFVIYFILWWRFGREPRGKGVIIPEFEPPQKLSPIQMGTAIDGVVDSRDVSALLIDLAIRGYLKIKEDDQKEYVFTRLKDPATLSVPYEKLILEELFKKGESVKLSSVAYTFYTTADRVKQAVKREILDQGYLNSTPYKGTGKSGCYGSILFLVILFVIGKFSSLDFQDLFAAWVLGTPVVVFFSCIMGHYFTKKGSEMRESILGFKLFLTVTEQERLKFFNAPDKKPELFEKYLPYAIVLRVEREWAKQFEGLYVRPPVWYDGNFKTGFTASAFAQHVGSFSTDSGSALTRSFSTASSGGGGYTPSSSSGFSGGSSGGGFGGGGGGSW